MYVSTVETLAGALRDVLILCHACVPVDHAPFVVDPAEYLRYPDLHRNGLAIVDHFDLGILKAGPKC